MTIRQGLVDAIGNTPLIRLRNVSVETGCEIFGKAEFMNPGGSVKDRAAKGIIEDYEAKGILKPGGILIEGTAGNTGIGFAHVCNARGYRCIIVMPDNQAPEKYAQIEAMAGQMRELSLRDALTGLHNRRHFDEQCAQFFASAQRYQRPFSLMLGDIDHFKSVNDRFSHAIGDEVLRRIGQLLRGSMRASDLVARYGGEEFVVAFPETDLQRARDACEALRQRVEAYPWHEVHPDLRVTISMGLSGGTHETSFHGLLDAADALLYRAKREGRNQVCSDTAMLALG